MNHVLVVTRNCLELTKRCIASVQAQTIPTRIMVIDNGSTDGTEEWLVGNQFEYLIWPNNRGVTSAWNLGLEGAFRYEEAQHVLVLNNDVALPPWFYESLLRCPHPFVTGVSVGTMEEIANEPTSSPTTSPDFSAFLIRKYVWERLGAFDEQMVMYAQDLDYHIRAHRAGIRFVNAQIPFYHERSSTLNHADPRERRLIELRADEDRRLFAAKWNCTAWGAGYEAMFAPQSFGIDMEPKCTTSS